MSLYTLSPVAVQTFEDANGVPYSGGLLSTFAAGTTTPATTYSDASGTPNANPIVLDSAGRCVIYLPASTFKFVLKTSAGVTVWTQDNVQSVGLATSGVYDVFDFEGDADSPVTNTAYVAGTTFDKCHAGSGWLVIDSANLAPGTYKLSGMLLSGDGALTMTGALMDLSSGADTTPLATIASTSATGANVVSSTITFPAAGANKTYAIKPKISVAGYGLGWNFKLVKVA